MPGSAGAAGGQPPAATRPLDFGPDSGRIRRVGLVGGTRCPGVALRTGGEEECRRPAREGVRAQAHRRWTMERAGGAGRSGGRENGVEGVFASHHEVRIRPGQVAEAAVKDDSERNVVQCGVVRGGVSGADASPGRPMCRGDACVARKAHVQGRRMRRPEGPKVQPPGIAGASCPPPRARGQNRSAPCTVSACARPASPVASRTASSPSAAASPSRQRRPPSPRSIPA